MYRSLSHAGGKYARSPSLSVDILIYPLPSMPRQSGTRWANNSPKRLSKFVLEDKKTFDCDIRLGPALSQTPKNMDAIVEMIILQVYINLYVFGKRDSPLVIGTEFPRCHRPGPSMYKCTDYGRGTWARSISSSALWLVVFRRKCQPAFSRQS